MYLCLSLLLLPVLYDFGPASFKFYLKLSVYYLSMTFIGLAILPVCLLHPREVENMLLPAALMRGVARVIGISYRVSDPKGSLGLDEPLVVVLNHQHGLDVLALFELWPRLRRCTTMAKVELLYYTGPFGWAAWLCGTTFIDRKKGKESRLILGTAVNAARSTNTKVAVFPEGTRHHDRHHRDLLPFRPGAFSAAVESGVRVLPVVVSHYGFLCSRTRVLEPGVVDITVLDPVKTEGYEGRVEGMAEAVREDMLKVFKK